VAAVYSVSMKKQQVTTPNNPCAMEDCAHIIHAKGLCMKHYRKAWEAQRTDIPACAVEECEKTNHRRGWCNAHYQRWKKYGDPLGVAIPTSPEERFWSKVDAAGFCWEWTGSRSNGYGMFHFEGRDVRAHRWAYEFLVCPIPEGLDLDHLCRNHACVNPDHLEPVSHRTNVIRGARPRQHAMKTHCPQGHPYDEVNTYRNPNHPSHRTCKACARKATMEWYYRRKGMIGT
jgi:hypothetical protein